MSIKKGKNQKTNQKEEVEKTEGDPICGRCGNTMLEEKGELLCPHCDGEIDFLGGEDEGLV